jgi:hypothetical protein
MRDAGTGVVSAEPMCHGLCQPGASNSIGLPRRLVLVSTRAMPLGERAGMPRGGALLAVLCPRSVPKENRAVRASGASSPRR